MRSQGQRQHIYLPVSIPQSGSLTNVGFSGSHWPSSRVPLTRIVVDDLRLDIHDAGKITPLSVPLATNPLHRGTHLRDAPLLVAHVVSP